MVLYSVRKIFVAAWACCNIETIFIYYCIEVGDGINTMSVDCKMVAKKKISWI
jgi:hypothetical protein